MEHNMTLKYDTNIQNIVDINESFCGGKLRVCYVGQNRNHSSISKKVLLNALPTIYNCPIVCNYDVENDTIGGHDMAMVRGADGELKLIHLTDPIGVIPESAEYGWETVEEDNGETHEYFYIDVILWKRSPAFNKIKEDGFSNHSMEISVHKGQLSDDILIIEDFTFLAFCLLGDDVEPCFESSELRLFDCDRYQTQFAAMMRDLKSDFSKVLSRGDTDNINTQNVTKGGKTQMEAKTNLRLEYGLTAAQLGVDLDAITYEELDTMVQEFGVSGEPEGNPEDNPEPEPTANPADDPIQTPSVEPDITPDPQTFSLTARQFLEELLNELHSVVASDEWGEYCRYCYFDHDTETNEVYCYDINDNWTLYGFNYSLNGDSVTIDFESKKRKKLIVVDFIEGDKADLLNYSTMVSAITEYSNREQKHNTEQLQVKLDGANEELNQLRNFKTEQLEKQRATQIKDVFNSFSELESVPEFVALKKNYGDLAVEDIKEKCFAIKGRNLQLFSQDAAKVRIPVDKTPNNTTDELYGGFYSEFPPSH